MNLHINGTVVLEAGTRDHSISNNANNGLVIRAGTGGDVIIMLG